MIVKIFLMAMMVFALLSVKTAQLRTAIIYLGIFSLINAVVYIFYGAPDVSLAEAIIGSTLATILYLTAIKKYKPVMIYHIHQNNKFSLSKLFGKKRNVLLDALLGILCIIMCFFALDTYANTIELTGMPAWDYYVRSFKQDTGASNAVTAIYLNYRIFDTLFEALLLLVSVIAVIYFSWRGEE